jgi:hypothetical protein
LCISGRITGDEVDMLRALLEQERSAVAFDLKDVLIMYRKAVKLLALRESNGTEIRNRPVYIREWVTRERAEAKAGCAEPGDRRNRGHREYANRR